MKLHLYTKNDIDTSTPEGKMLVAAIGILVTEQKCLKTDITAGEYFERIRDIASWTEQRYSN